MSRPPAQDTEDTEVVEFGIPVVDDHLGEVSLTFPADVDEITEAVGHVTIPYDAAGHTITLDEALSQVDQDHFESKNEFLNALHSIFESYRKPDNMGPFATLRRYLPF